MSLDIKIILSTDCAIVCFHQVEEVIIGLPALLNNNRLVIFQERGLD